MINSPNPADVNRYNSTSEFPLKTWALFFALSVVLSFVYLEIVMPRGAHFPLWLDAYQYLENYDRNFKNGGRWFNYLTFDLISALPKRLAYYLDLLTTAVLWLCFLRPKQTTHHFLLFSVLCLVILSSNIMFSVRFWPGGRIMTNLATILAVVIIHSNLRLIVKLPLIFLAILAIGGGYQFHHLMLILAFITAPRSVPYNWKSFVLITGLWIVGFITAYVFADLLSTLKFGDGRSTVRGYRALDDSGGSKISKLFSNLEIISRSMFGSFVKTISKYPFFYISPVLLMIGAVIGIRHMSIPKDALYRVLWWTAPILGIVVILAVANHRFYPRLNLSSLMAIMLGLWIVSKESPMAMKTIMLGAFLYFIPQVIINRGQLKAIDRGITQTLDRLVPIYEADPIDAQTQLVVFDLDQTLKADGKNIGRFARYFKEVLEVDRFTYCDRIEKNLCRRLNGSRKIEVKTLACETPNHIYKERQGRRILIYVFDRKSCE